MPSIIDFGIATLILFGLGSAVGNIAMLAHIACEGVHFADKFLNPITLYQKHKVNVFGCIMLTLFFNVFFILHAIWFWFYKLCTVGRR